MKDQMDVCALARGVMLRAGSTLSTPLQDGVSLLPSSSSRHTYRLALRLTFPSGRCTGFPCSVSVTHGWVRRALSTGSVDAHDKEGRSPCTRYRAFWLKPGSTFGLFSVTMFNQAFTWVRPANPS